MQVYRQTSYIASTVLHDLSSFSILSHFSVRYVFLDTPGQIEVFTWSASGAIIMETLVCAHNNISVTIFLKYTRIACSGYRVMSQILYNLYQQIDDLVLQIVFVVSFRIFEIFWHGVWPFNA